MRCFCLVLLLGLNLSLLFSQSTITFVLERVPVDSKIQVGIRGNIAPLSWDKSIPLEEVANGYSATLEFMDTDATLEFKFVQYTDDQHPKWETTQNRTIELKKGDTTSYHTWNQEQVIDISSLKPISSEALLEDYKLMETMVLEVHPGTYRYNSKAQIKQALKELKQAFQAPNTHGEAYLALSKLTAQLKCDHTKPGFNNQNKIINSIIHYQKDKLPFTFKWINNQMVIIRNASNQSALKQGVVVQAINGISVDSIKEKLLPYIGADGATDKNRLYKLEVAGYDFRYYPFDIFFPLQFPWVGDSLDILIQPINSDHTQSITVHPLTREERFEVLKTRYPNFPATRDDLWQFQIIDNQVGWLTINSYGLYGWKAMTLDYKQFLADAFKTLADQKLKHLVIDIRENTGGNDEMADELFDYLTPIKEPFDRMGRTRYVTFPAFLKPYVQTWGNDPWYFELNPKEKEPTDGYYFFKENYSAADQKSDKPIFQGKVYLLISSANTSLAFYTALRFKEQAIGTMIGQETGGNLNDVNGGQILFLRLPNSQIEVDFPVMGAFMSTPQPDHGVQPDIETHWDRAAIIQNRDVEKERVLAIIKKTK